ncbi:MAG: substrate-binding domain-containing protein [Pseudomonadota bacterium]
MKSFERISAILTCFSPTEPHLRIDRLLRRTGIPMSSGYKLISDLVAEGLLRRVARGTVALGPSAADLFYSPRRALMPMRGGVGLAGVRVASAPRKSHLESDLLNLVTTDQFRKEPPFTIGFANASSAHPWRMALERSLLSAAKSQSEIVEQVVVRNAENDPVLQAEQLLEMRDDGVDLCIISAAVEQNALLESSIDRLADENMPLVGVDRFCGATNNLVSFVTASDETVGRISALWLAERLNGKGKIVLLCGLETASPCKIRLEAGLRTFAQFPDIEIAAIEFTDWLADRGYQAIQRHLKAGFLPDGVWCDSGLQGIGSLNAFLDHGFQRGTIPPHTGGEMNLMYKMAVQERVPLCGLDYPAAMGAASFHVAIDALSGRPVPRVLETDMQVIVTRGHETKSVRADIHAEKKVDWNSPDDHVHAAGRTRKRKAMQDDVSRSIGPDPNGRKMSLRSNTDAARRLLDIAIVVAQKPVATAYDVARTLDLPMSSTYQAINDLESMSWLSRDEDGNLLVGMVPQQIALAAFGHDVAARSLQAVVRFLRDQTGETAFGGCLKDLLHIGPHLTGYNPNSVRFERFQELPVEVARVPNFETGALKLRCGGGQAEVGPAIHFLAMPLQPSATGFEEGQLVVGISTVGRKIDEEKIVSHFSEIQAVLRSSQVTEVIA